MGGGRGIRREGRRCEAHGVGWGRLGLGWAGGVAAHLERGGNAGHGAATPVEVHGAYDAEQREQRHVRVLWRWQRTPVLGEAAEGGHLDELLPRLRVPRLWLGFGLGLGLGLGLG